MQYAHLWLAWEANAQIPITVEPRGAQAVLRIAHIVLIDRFTKAGRQADRREGAAAVIWIETIVAIEATEMNVGQKRSSRNR